MSIVVDTTKLQQLTQSIRSGSTGNEIAKRAAARGVEIVEQSYSGFVPPRSKPGEPPAIDTGALRDSLRTKRQRVGHWRVIEGGNSAPYAGFLEYGTSKMAARPHMRPMAEQLADEVADAARIVFKAEL